MSDPAVITNTGRSSMGDIDVAICEYIAENERVADLFNGLYFQGERRIHAENIEDYEEKYPVKYPTGGKRSKHTGKVRYRDIVKKLKSGGSLRILAMENQNQVDYTMPFRCMEYDTLEYRRQIDRRIRDNEKISQWSSEAEFLCGVRKTDRFAPVYTVCLYHGKEAWDGPRSLKDMMDFGSDPDQLPEGLETPAQTGGVRRLPESICGYGGGDRGSIGMVGSERDPDEI